ncbi:MAG: hypothetical protein WA419_15720 [Silvibacterium sp.]
MKSEHTNRILIRLMSIAALLLAISVLTWGTEYKASLYQKNKVAGHSVLVAKLLSERERPASVNLNPGAPSAPQLVATSLWLFVIPMLGCEAGFPRRAMSRDRSSPPDLLESSLSFFFFRPPPISVS